MCRPTLFVGHGHTIRSRFGRGFQCMATVRSQRSFRSSGLHRYLALDGCLRRFSCSFDQPHSAAIHERKPIRSPNSFFQRRVEWKFALLDAAPDTKTERPEPNPKAMEAHDCTRCLRFVPRTLSPCHSLLGSKFNPHTSESATLAQRCRTALVDPLESLLSCARTSIHFTRR
jgi:hypothetical protein